MSSKAKPSPSSRKRKSSSGNKKQESGPPAISITNYTTALKWLNAHTDYERQRVVRYNPTNFNIERMGKLLAAMGDPHKQIRFVHVAGTKGKGSVVAMLAAMLEANGYTIGTYTSPHLVDLRERIQVNNQLISHAALTEAFKTVKSKAKKLGDNIPTFFEIMTAAAIQHFADEAVDLAILETGMGGRLDSTNVVTPEVAIIAEISYDHMDALGNTLAEIAREKAGIMKKGVPVVTFEQEPEVEAVLREVADQVGAELITVGRDLEFTHRFESSRDLGPHSRICITAQHETYDHVPVPLKGEHQARNCALAIAALDRLRGLGFRSDEERLVQGLAATSLPGRMELAWQEPRIILDGAHNAASIMALMRALGAHMRYDSLVVVFGCGQDKDVQGMLNELRLGADKVIFTRAKANPRAMEPKDLLAQFSEVSGKMAQTAPDLEQALQLAAKAVGREDMICVTGSFYLVGEARKYLTDLAAKRAKQNA